MGLESLEKIETIPTNEIVDDKLEPLTDCSNECCESAQLEDIETLQSRYEGAEFVTDLEMSEGIADYLENVEEIKYENWQNLSLEQKTVPKEPQKEKSRIKKLIEKIKNILRNWM